MASLGKYRIIAELGHGGMADVLLAMCRGPAGTGFTKLVVLKRVREHLAHDPEFIAMLVDEARITARLNHPNVVQTLEVGFENDEYFLALEFLDGQPLRRLQRRGARRGTPLDRDLSYVIIADTLAGLDHAHALADYDGTPLGIVHRDVTPHNVFVTYEGIVKVVDFGIAKATGRAVETKHGIVKGKIRYMSPEQAMGRDVDRRTDVFAVGVMLWEAATGRRFWPQGDEESLVTRLISGDFERSPRAAQPDVPPAIDAICRKALAYDPDDRYGTAAAVRQDLEAFLGDKILDARRRLGPYAASLFEKDRAAVRAVVERAGREDSVPQSARLRAAASAERAEPSTSTEATELMSLPAALAGAEPPGAPAVANEPQAISGEPPPLRAAPRRTRARRLIAAAASIVLVTLVLLLASSTLELRSRAGEGGARVPAQVDPSANELSVRSTAAKALAAGSTADGLAAAGATSAVLAATARTARQSASTARSRDGQPPAAPPPDSPVTSGARATSSARPGGPKTSLDTTDPWQAGGGTRGNP
ncbi:MAG: serine/threonine protein kinase [Labilithrix sp.]|nr:serine/threonine protein kinase [Labilithrix sp.]